MKFVGESTPAWTFSNTPKKVVAEDTSNPFITSPTTKRSKSRLTVPGPAKYEIKRNNSKDKAKWVSIPTAGREVNNSLLLTGVSPGPAKYDTRVDILKPLPRIFRKKNVIPKKSGRYDPVDPRKMVPDPGAYKIRKSFAKKNGGYTFGCNVKNKSMIEFR